MLVILMIMIIIIIIITIISIIIAMISTKIKIIQIWITLPIEWFAKIIFIKFPGRLSENLRDEGFESEKFLSKRMW